MNSIKEIDRTILKKHKIKDILVRIKNPVEITPEKTYQEIGIRSHGKGIFYKNPVTGRDIGNKSVFWIEPNCFIVNIVFAWERAVAKTTDNEVDFIASHRFPMYKPDSEIVDLDYLTFYFKMKKGKYLLELASPGGAGRNKTLGQKEFEKLEILLPPLKTQQKVATFITLLEQRIEKQQEKIEALKEQKKGLLQKIFSQEIRFKDNEGKDFPAWVTKRLDDLGKFEKSYSYSRAFEGEGKIRHLHYGDIHSKYNSIVDAEKLPSISSEEKHDYLKEGELIFADASEDYKDLGKCLVFTNQNGLKAIAGLHTHRFTVNKENDSRFLMYYTKTKQYSSFIRRIGNGISVLGISKKNLGTLEIALPILEEQKKIADFFSLLDDRIEKSERIMGLLKIQKKGFMQQMFV